MTEQSFLAHKSEAASVFILASDPLNILLPEPTRIWVVGERVREEKKNLFILFQEGGGTLIETLSAGNSIKKSTFNQIFLALVLLVTILVHFFLFFLFLAIVGVLLPR